MADTQRQRLEAREDAILAAATAVFGESGVDGARMAEIARRADVAEGTVYLTTRTNTSFSRLSWIVFGGS